MRISGEPQIKIIADKIKDGLDRSECFAVELEMALRTLIELYEKGWSESQAFEILSKAKKDLANLVNNYKPPNFHKHPALDSLYVSNLDFD